jgi:hypothetical protein
MERLTRTDAGAHELARCTFRNSQADAQMSAVQVRADEGGHAPLNRREYCFQIEVTD